MTQHKSDVARIYALWQAWERMHQDPPRLLYHYTSAEGLLGMLEGRQLWATNVRFMNDTTELGYGIGQVREVLQEPVTRRGRRHPRSERASRQNREDILAMLADTEANTKHFAVCFCENGDLLSQWRGYGALGSGFAVGLHGKKLCDFTAPFLPGAPPNLGVILRRVIYDMRIQKSLVRRWIKYIDAGADAQAAFPILRMLYECLVCFKDPGFKEEREWRLIQQGRVGGDDICKESFRAREGRIVTYLPLSFPSRAEARSARKPAGSNFPVAAITYGPTVDDVAAGHALRALVKHHGFDPRKLTVKSSVIPFST
jgi:hypothetical protein